ncbi:type I pullulanase [uncultured Muribaculum sp.]|uniref:type I pullulanase n=2 Tax=uncultured Muribaculum sp. TaxID=1918613 RepID=UPI00266F1936|nr:type I pullulanase [uncultured Muribaculum sp.]
MKLCSAAMAVSALACLPNEAESQNPDAVYSEYETYNGRDLELTVNDSGTHFALWSPKAQQAQVLIYESGRNTPAVDTLQMSRSERGVWRVSVPGKLYGMFYTFQVRINGKWLSETPGVWAKAVGVNGKRAAIIDFESTNPDGWDTDKSPEIKAINDAVIYEMHHRDFSMHPSSGIANKGKFLALTESGTTSPYGDKTGIDHLKELGVTHVHILPSYDYNSVDETQLPSNQYNWGYDPYNYNAPEGSYSTNPSDPSVRIREMKQMVKALHEAGIGVIMDVVYNHTSLNDDSNFSLTAPGYYYRHKPDGSYSDASACGNETASERKQVRDYIVNSVKYWADEYHIDGFRFDLMAIHDTATMNEVARELKTIRPDIFVYGEGWTAGDSPLPVEQRALKDNVSAMPQVAVFSDDIRDAVKGHYTDATDRGFATGKPGLEETVKIGIVGATAHPQVDYSKGNNSKKPYALSPTQVINYVSCHDDLTLTDKLRASLPDKDDSMRQRAAKLAQTIVFTSQGTPFLFAGEEIFRDKKGVHNSYKSPDSVNAIDWSLKQKNADLFQYYQELIRLRKEHPAFRMKTAGDVARHLVFDKKENRPGVITYMLKDNANGDSWKEIMLVFNGNDAPVDVNVPKADWLVVAQDGRLVAKGLGNSSGGKMSVAPCSALILAREK